ncbi:MAG: hypothetical protein J5493_05270 [Lachnospiraceae bacterium]|nr:hypothetical protein [Lachnospiraceae bacterium]
MKRKEIKEKIGTLTYMQTSLGLFGLCLVLLIVLFVRSVVSGGGLARWEGILGVAGLLLSLTGFLVPLYGKYVVRTKDRPDFRLGLLLNGILFLIYVFFYFLGV